METANFSKRALVKVSGTRYQINVILNELIKVFGKDKVLYNYPLRDQRTGFHYIFINIILPPSNSKGGERDVRL